MGEHVDNFHVYQINFIIHTEILNKIEMNGTNNII